MSKRVLASWIVVAVGLSGLDSAQAQSCTPIPQRVTDNTGSNSLNGWTIMNLDGFGSSWTTGGLGFGAAQHWDDQGLVNASVPTALDTASQTLSRVSGGAILQFDVAWNNAQYSSGQNAYDGNQVQLVVSYAGTTYLTVATAAFTNRPNTSANAGDAGPTNATLSVEGGAVLLSGSAPAPFRAANGAAPNWGTITIRLPDNVPLIGILSIGSRRTQNGDPTGRTDDLYFRNVTLAPRMLCLRKQTPGPGTGGGNFSFATTNLDTNLVTVGTQNGPLTMNTSDATAVLMPDADTATAGVNPALVMANAVTVTETINTPGFALTSATCDNGVTGAISGNQVTLSQIDATTAAGLMVTCTLTNARPRLRLQKQLSDGRVSTSDQFQLTVSGPRGGANTTAVATTTGSASTATGVADFNPADSGGSYTFSEAGAGTTNLVLYSTSYSCTNTRTGGQTPSGTGTSFNVTPVAGDDLTCTFRNASRPRLTLVKTVTNDNGGTQPAGAWTLSAAGPINISGATGAAAVTNASVDPGTYTLSESATPTGYAASTYSCVKNGGAAVSSNSIALVAGDVATCTINNNDRPATLTLVKTVTNDNGGTQLATAWTLSAAGPTNISGATGAAAVTNAFVNAGTYTLSESATPTGYTASTYSCIKNGGAAVVSNSIALVAGDTATCTINNNDTNQTDVRIQKTAAPSPVLSGTQVQFTLVVNNQGLAAAHGVVVRDPAVAGLDCTAASLPAPSCSATGGATCPAALTASGLQAGIAIPALPNGGVATIVLTCNVTASGVP